jgi:hypothetical protein
LPGVQSAWSKDGIKLSQLALCTLLDGTEVKTGREPLLAFVRYALTNARGPARKIFLRLNMVEMGIFDARDPKTSWINATVEKYVMCSGLPTLVRPGYIDAHYVYNQALSQLLRGETEKFLWTFYSMFAYGQTRATYSTVECNDIFTGSSGENWDALRQPHEHSNSRVLAMVRIALVLEEQNTLHLMAGAPRGWLEPEKVIEVKNAPIYFGAEPKSPVDFENYFNFSFGITGRRMCDG